MPDSYTAFLNMTKPEVGASPNTWGTKFNTNLDTIDANAKSLDTAVKAARGVADAAVKRAGDTMTGGLTAPVITVNGTDGSAGLWFRPRSAGTDQFLLVNQDNKLGVYDVEKAYTVFEINNAGNVWTRAIGDLKYYIDTADAARVAKAGDVMTGGLGVKGQITSKQDNAGYVSLSPGNDTNPGYIEWRTKDGLRRGYMGGNSGSKLQIQAENGWGFDFTGAVPTINGKPIYYADNLDLSSRVAKTGDTMSGALTANAGVIIASGAGEQQLWFTRNGLNNWRIVQGGDGQLNFNISDKYFQFRSDGGFSWPQVGDAKTYIDSTADNRLATARGEYGVKFDKAGGTISGATDFTAGVSVTRTYPSINFHYPNVRQFRWEVRDDARMHLRSPDSGDQSIISVGWDGDIWMKQLGDLNSRIEARGQAWADNAVNRSVTSGRWVIAGQKGYNDQPGTGGFISPFGAHTMNCDYWTWRFTAGDGQVGSSPFAGRWRAFQIYIATQGWVTCGAAS